MPLSGLIANRILCMHGGLSPLLTDIEQLRQIKRPLDPPNPSLALDLLWSDPDKWTVGWAQNSRGVSYVFGEDVLKSLCEKLEIDLVARAHQVVQDGYEFFADRRLVTIFSAPHYCGQFDNAAASMRVTEDLSCDFKVYRPATKAERLAAEAAEQEPEDVGEEDNQPPQEEKGSEQ
ncbi:hypothetical protein AB6A40_003009 [Gnathostoma spinigerum]|uniref:protein-serine/threonine phosphatase n=1 Tax=Gnathostoma spinigerum TaxID=75299 RepID=A0ABD6E9F7_9BILA